VGVTSASFFARSALPVGLANKRGAAAVEPVASQIAAGVTSQPLDEDLEA
jgi:hypothetical protein